MKILSNIFYGLFITLLVGVAALLLVSLVPITGNVEIKIVKSGSMEPAIPTGSVVVVVPSQAYAVGDVVTFGRDTAREIPTTHRIVGERTVGGQTYFITKGDANEEQDPNEVMARDVIGKVAFHVPGAGYVLDFARQPLGFALLIGVPAVMIVVDESVTIVKEFLALRRRKREGNEEVVEESTMPPLPQKPHALRDKVPTI